MQSFSHNSDKEEVHVGENNRCYGYRCYGLNHRSSGHLKLGTLQVCDHIRHKNLEAVNIAGNICVFVEPGDLDRYRRIGRLGNQPMHKKGNRRKCAVWALTSLAWKIPDGESLPVAVFVLAIALASQTKFYFLTNF